MQDFNRYDHWKYQKYTMKWILESIWSVKVSSTMKMKWGWNRSIIKSSKKNENEKVIWIDLTDKSATPGTSS